MVLWYKAPAVAVAPCGRAVRSGGTPSRGELVLRSTEPYRVTQDRRCFGCQDRAVRG